MANLRFTALEKVMSRQPVEVENQDLKYSELFRINVFDPNKMREYLSEEAFEVVLKAIKTGGKIDAKIASDVANAMKIWAVSRGATHFTHWFQPLTGSTAEKHDAFFEPTHDGGGIENFNGKSLVQQEPDASAFPSGGLRDTFEARGYTAWDPSSPAFIYGKTLCIPTIFVSYTGEALDFKAPLLRALAALDEAATGVAQYFDKEVEKVQATLGWEQEFFLLDTALFSVRPDLQLTGRTLFGFGSAKNQQLNDNYLGSINSRTVQFLTEVEHEALKLGIPVKTRHNEVAPTQFEIAPSFEECNLAVDHNQLLNEVMKKIARRHHFKVIFHEKPYQGVNGSGKHNNWSLKTDSGINLLKPGKNPKQNLQFLTFFVCAIKAVHDYGDILRASFATPGNDLRLGGGEAPPAIMSVFIGREMTKMLEEIEKKVKGGKMSPELKTEIKLNIGKIPQILIDNTDSNRTSPFAFTGNKFEIRSAGSTLNCASVMIAINTMMAKVLKEFKKEVDLKVDKGLKKDEAIFEILRKFIVASKKIRFEGDGYSEQWIKESAKRGLSNVPKTIYAIEENLSNVSIELFSKMKVMQKSEIDARYIINVENYQKIIQIEARVLGDIALNHIIPAALKFQSQLIENVNGLQLIYKDRIKEMARTQLLLIEEISDRVNKINNKVFDLIEKRKVINNIKDISTMAKAYCDQVIPYFDEIRNEVDKLEQIVDNELWPLPKYRELLFAK